MTDRPDQLDMQVHLAVQRIRREDLALKLQIELWEPRPCPKDFE